jgi:hypothetical protein
MKKMWTRGVGLIFLFSMSVSSCTCINAYKIKPDQSSLIKEHPQRKKTAFYDQDGLQVRVWGYGQNPRLTSRVENKSSDPVQVTTEKVKLEIMPNQVADLNFTYACPPEEYAKGEGGCLVQQAPNQRSISIVVKPGETMEFAHEFSIQKKESATGWEKIRYQNSAVSRNGKSIPLEIVFEKDE